MVVVVAVAGELDILLFQMLEVARLSTTNWRQRLVGGRFARVGLLVAFFWN